MSATWAVNDGNSRMKVASSVPSGRSTISRAWIEDDDKDGVDDQHRHPARQTDPRHPLDRDIEEIGEDEADNERTERRAAEIEDGEQDDCPGDDEAPREGSADRCGGRGFGGARAGSDAGAVAGGVAAGSTGGSGGLVEAAAVGRSGSAGDGAGSGPTGSSIVAADYQTWTRRPSLPPHPPRPRRRPSRRASAGG